LILPPLPAPPRGSAYYGFYGTQLPPVALILAEPCKVLVARTIEPPEPPPLPTEAAFPFALSYA